MKQSKLESDLYSSTNRNYDGSVKKTPLNTFHSSRIYYSLAGILLGINSKPKIWYSPCCALYSG